MSKAQTVMKASKIFSLTNLRSDCYYTSVTVDFTAPVNVTKPSDSIAPVFLRDRKAYTPSFIHPNDEAYFTGNTTYEKSKFEERVLKAHLFHQQLEDSGRTPQELEKPVPSSAYCQICRQSFTSYLEHIQEDAHLRQTSRRVGNQYIAEICEKVEKTKMRKGRCKKIKKAEKQKAEKIVRSTIQTRSQRRAAESQNRQTHPKAGTISTNIHSLGQKQD